MKSKPDQRRILKEIRGHFETLSAAWGPQHWWPADSPFEVIVGAILTQNTAWTNVEKALANLRKARALTLKGIRNTQLHALEQMIRPAGYFRQKAARLKTFVTCLDKRYAGSLKAMFSTPTLKLREELLELNGIGPETADSILLYAGQHEIFVVDAYTRRIFERHNLIVAGGKYDDLREQVEMAMQVARQSFEPPKEGSGLVSVERAPCPAEEVLTAVVHTPSKMSETQRSELAQRYNEFHALLVQTAKHYCQSRVARCELCPLRTYLKEPVLILSRKDEERRRK